MSASRCLPGPILILFLAGATPSMRTVRPWPQETGREIFAAVCATCHTVHPPPTRAPAMSEIADRYSTAATDSAHAVALIADWIREPDADRSLLSADAVVTYGVMPQIGLGEARIAAVARYVLTLADSAAGPQAASTSRHGHGPQLDACPGMMREAGGAAIRRRPLRSPGNATSSASRPGCPS